MVQQSYETENLCLLLSEPDLAPLAAEYYRRNREFFNDFDPLHEENFFTEDFQRKSLIEDCIRAAANAGYRFWMMEKGDSGSIIGTIALSSIVWGAFQSCFLGYKLDKAHLGRGYMTQAVKKVVEIAFRDIGLHRVEANIMPKNKASLRVTEKAGFLSEGISKEYLKINGVWEDHIHMVMLNAKMR